MYLKKVQEINSGDKVSLNHWFKGVFFAPFAWNEGPVDRTEIAQSLVDISKKSPFKINPP